MTIWIILMLSVFSGALGLATLNANAEANRITREVYRKHGLGLLAPVGCLIALSGLATMAAWVVYSAQIGDWRFAAIAAIPFLISWAGQVLRSWAGKPSVTVKAAKDPAV